MNGLKIDANIYVGQILKIPSKGSTAPTPEPPAFKPYDAVVNTSNGLNVRKGPGTSHAVLRVLGNGTRVRITKEQDGWGFIADLAGWISLAFVIKR